MLSSATGERWATKMGQRGWEDRFMKMIVKLLLTTLLIAPLASCSGDVGDESLGSASAPFILGKTNFLRNLQTQRCLDSNSAGKVYTNGCYWATYQGWVANLVQNNYELRNLQTGRCLDSNSAGKLYTSPCNTGQYQQWAFGTGAGTVVNIATGRYLDSNSNGEAYTLPANGGNYQRWEFFYNP